MPRYITKDQEHQIKTIMYAKKVCVKDLPDLIGGSRTHWVDLLNGKRQMDADEIIKLSKLLGISKTPQRVLDLFFDFTLHPEIKEIV